MVTMAVPLQFSQFMFKLMVMNELMYRRKSIPPFNLADLEAQLGRKLYERGSWQMTDADYNSFMPEIKAWFEAYPITADQVADLEMLRFGETQIALDVAPNWDGEDALFDITAQTATDVHLLPNLRSIVATYDRAHRDVIEAAFAKHGVTLKPLYP